MIMQMEWSFEFPTMGLIKQALVKGFKAAGRMLGFVAPVIDSKAAPSIGETEQVLEKAPEASIYKDAVVRDKYMSRRAEVWRHYVVKGGVSMRQLAKQLGVSKTTIRRDIHTQQQHSMNRAYYLMDSGKSNHEIHMECNVLRRKYVLVRLTRRPGESWYTATRIGGVYRTLHDTYTEWFRENVVAQYGFPVAQYVHYQTANRTPSFGPGR